MPGYFCTTVLLVFWQVGRGKGQEVYAFPFFVGVACRSGWRSIPSQCLLTIALFGVLSFWEAFLHNVVINETAGEIDGKNQLLNTQYVLIIPLNGVLIDVVHMPSPAILR